MIRWLVRGKAITEYLRRRIETIKSYARQHHLSIKKLQRESRQEISAPASEPLVTEIGSVIDAFNAEESIEVTTTPSGIRLLPTNDEIWLSPEGAKKMIGLLRAALSAVPGEPAECPCPHEIVEWMDQPFDREKGGHYYRLFCCCCHTPLPAESFIPSFIGPFRRRLVRETTEIRG